MPKYTRIIFIGDIVGRAGRKAAKNGLAALLKDDQYPTITIANVENAAGGFGLTKKVYNELVAAGIDIFTGGNHIWDKADVSHEHDDFSMLSTPVNLRTERNEPYVVHVEPHGLPLSVISISGKVFMPAAKLGDANTIADPFITFDSIYESENCAGRAVIIDFHAEATSEKGAFAEYTRGRACAVIGTHTHVQTADERILPSGTFFITDAGSCCAVNSIIGMSVESSLARFTSQQPSRMAVEADGAVMFNGVELIVDCETKRVQSYRRINEAY